MSKLKHRIARFIKDESGPTAVEYAVMLALIIGVCIGSITLFGESTAGLWSGNSVSIDTAFNN